MAGASHAPLHAHSNGNTTDGDDDNEQPCESEQSKLLHDRLARFLASPGSEHATRAASSAATWRSEVKGDVHDGVAEARAQDDDMCGPWMCAGVSAGTPAAASCGALLTVQSAASASNAASSPLLAPPVQWTPRAHVFTHTHHFLREQVCRRSSRAARHASRLNQIGPPMPPSPCPHQCFDGPMHQCANASMHQCANASMRQCVNAPMHQCTNAPMHQCTTAPLQSAPMHHCTTAPLHHSCGWRRSASRGYEAR